MGLFGNFRDSVEKYKFNRAIDKHVSETQRRRESYYSDYDNYSNYSDMAERKKILLRLKSREIETKKDEVNEYKSQNVNVFLQSQELIQQTGVNVSIAKLKIDGDTKIKNEESVMVEEESYELQMELDTIDAIITKIDKIMESR